MDPMPYEFMQARGLTPSRLLNVPHETILLNVQENMGYSIAPRLAIISENNISILEIEDLNETCDVYMVWKENNTNPMLEHFLDISRQP
jgi:DNA-binding transcriptional LysR family regulator